MVPFIATTAIIPVALWDSGPEPEERSRIAVIMETFQTTFAANWVGASGSIVARLYANENNEYNIISCENYGSIYKSAEFRRKRANDSAEFLGNITTYQVSNVSNASSLQSEYWIV